MFNVWVTPEMRDGRFFAMTWAGAFHRRRLSFRWLADYQMVAVINFPGTANHPAFVLQIPLLIQ